MGTTERVVLYIDYKGVSKYKFCKDLGFSNKFLDNSSNMGTDKACKILLHFPEINPEWLLTGNGHMLKSEAKKEVISEDIGFDINVDYKELAEARLEIIKGKDETILSKSKLIEMLDNEIVRLAEELKRFHGIITSGDDKRQVG